MRRGSPLPRWERARVRVKREERGGYEVGFPLLAGEISEGQRGHNPITVHHSNHKNHSSGFTTTGNPATMNNTRSQTDATR